jgi:hypothetical protein
VNNAIFKEVIMRELTQNELNVIAGGDRGTYTAWGSAIGGFVGPAVGTGGTPLASAALSGLGSLAGYYAGNIIADIAGEE